jgi:hypothetical protein
MSESINVKRADFKQVASRRTWYCMKSRDFFVNAIIEKDDSLMLAGYVSFYKCDRWRSPSSSSDQAVTLKITNDELMTIDGYDSEHIRNLIASKINEIQFY